jgi:K+-transporting ATPase KdpF subunit
MSHSDVLALVVSALLVVYLCYALLRGERL